MTRITKSEYETLAAFRYSLRQFLHFSEEAAQSVGLAPQQHQALLSIKGFPGRDKITIKELAEQLQIRHQSGQYLWLISHQRGHYHNSRMRMTDSNSHRL